MILEAFSQYVIVKLDQADEKVGAESTLYAPGTLLKAFDVPKRTGTVKAVGRGLVTAGGHIIPMQSKPGDRVYVIEMPPQPNGTKIENKIDFGGEDCIVMNDETRIIGRIIEEQSLLITEGR